MSTATEITTAERNFVYTVWGERMYVQDGCIPPPSSSAEALHRFEEWCARNAHFLTGYSSEQFVAEKRREVELENLEND